jgi:hypothetical protein
MKRLLFTPRGFLISGGIVMTVLGALGALGILSQTFTPGFWVDQYESVVYLVLGIFALLAVYLPVLNRALKPWYRRIVQVYGVIALLAGLYGFAAVGVAEPNVAGLANFEPAEFVWYLVLATWAFAAGYYPLTEAGPNAAAAA